MYRELVIATAMALSGCAMQQSAVANKAKEQLVGKSEEEVLLCMGVPHAQMESGEVEVWAYNSGGSTIGFSSGNAYVNGNWVQGNSVGIRQSNYCVVNLAMKDGEVVSVNYQGRTGRPLAPSEECYGAVRNCLEPSSNSKDAKEDGAAE